MRKTRVISIIKEPFLPLQTVMWLCSLVTQTPAKWPTWGGVRWEKHTWVRTIHRDPPLSSSPPPTNTERYLKNSVFSQKVWNDKCVTDWHQWLSESDGYLEVGDFLSVWLAFAMTDSLRESLLTTRRTVAQRQEEYLLGICLKLILNI